MTPRQGLRRLWIGTATELLCVGLLSAHGDFRRVHEAAAFTVLAVCAGVAFWVAARGLTHARLSARAGAWWFWAVAVALRLAMLPTVPGDDLWRYRWEGEVQLHGFNPYVVAPDSPRLAGLRDADWSRINHPNVPAIYPPLAECTFATLARDGVSVLGYKLLLALADLGVAGILRGLLMRGRSPPEGAAWYGWNPLVLYASAGAAHYDSLMLLVLTGAIWCLDRLPPASVWRTPPLAWAGAGLLGAAIALKAAPAVLLPVWFFALGWRRALMTLPLAVAVTPALAMRYGFPRVPVFATLGSFARDYRVNDAFWWILDPANRAHALTPWIAGAAGVGLAGWFRRDWRRGMLWVFGAALLLSPQVHAWYVVWVLPLAVWRGERARAWTVLSVSVFGYFLLWEINRGSGRPWEEPFWLRAFVYGPPLAAWGWWERVRPSADAAPAETC